MDRLLENIKSMYDLNDYGLITVPGHEGGRNLVYVCAGEEKPEYVLRLSLLDDRKKDDYLAEAEFIHYLAGNGAPVTDVIPSSNGNLVESFSLEEKECFVICTQETGHIDNLISFSRWMLSCKQQGASILF